MSIKLYFGHALPTAACDTSRKSIPARLYGRIYQYAAANDLVPHAAVLRLLCERLDQIDKEAAYLPRREQSGENMSVSLAISVPLRVRRLLIDYANRHGIKYSHAAARVIEAGVATLKAKEAACREEASAQIAQTIKG